jgi:hypothetical protein
MPLQPRDRIVLAIESTKTLQNDATVFKIDPYSYVGLDGQTYSYAGATSTASAMSSEITEYHPTRTIELPNPTGTMYVQPYPGPINPTNRPQHSLHHASRSDPHFHRPRTDLRSLDHNCHSRRNLSRTQAQHRRDPCDRSV